MRESSEICENLGFRWILSLRVGAGLKFEKGDFLNIKQNMCTSEKTKFTLHFRQL
jgi:hypothetical protein